MARTSQSVARRGRPEASLWSEFMGWPEAGPFGEFFRAVRGEGIRVEEYVDNGTLVVRAELPGIDPDKDVTLTVSNGMLRMKAERQESKKSETAAGYRSEFHYGTLTRVMPLPTGVSEKDIKATYADGVLEVRLPLPKEEETTRTIPIQRG